MLVFSANQSKASSALVKTVIEKSGERIQDCYQCGKCSAGCPVSGFMDLAPHQILRAVQLGQVELALKSSTIWLCTSCQTCAARCPEQVDLARVMDALRQIARAEGIAPKEKSVVWGHTLFLESVKRLGRLYEVGLVAGINMVTFKPFDNVMDVGLPLFAKGKLNLLPPRAGGKQVPGLFKSEEKK